MTRWVIVYTGLYGQEHYVTPRTFKTKKEAVESLGAGKSRSIRDRFIKITSIEI